MMAVRNHFLVLLSLVLVCAAREIHGRTVVSLMRQTKITSDDNTSVNGGSGDTQAVEFASAGIDAIADVIDLGSIDPEDIIRKCVRGKCSFCVGKGRFNACLIAEVTHTGFMLEVTLDGKVLFKKEINAADVPPVCVKDAIPGIAKACVTLTKVDIKELSACVTVDLETTFHMKFHLNLGCFKIPHLESIPMVETDDDKRTVQTDVSWIDFKVETSPIKIPWDRQ